MAVDVQSILRLVFCSSMIILLTPIDARPNRADFELFTWENDNCSLVNKEDLFPEEERETNRFVSTKVNLNSCGD